MTLSQIANPSAFDSQLDYYTQEYARHGMHGPRKQQFPLDPIISSRDRMEMVDRVLRGNSQLVPQPTPKF